MARYLLVGALGGPNFGDELILLTWINVIRQRDPAAQIFVDGYNLNEIKITIDGLADVVEENESLWRLCFEVSLDKKISVWENFSKFSTEKHTDLYRKLHYLSKKDIDYIHIIGGGYFNSIWKSNYLILAVSRLLSWLTGARLVATGLGLMPTDVMDVAGLRALLNSFDWVDVRDMDSYSLLGADKQSKISYTGDDALLSLTYNGAVYPLREIDDPSIILCLQNDLFDGNGTLAEIFTPDVIDVLSEHGISNVVFAKAMSDDVSEFTDGLRAILERAGFRISTYEPLELIKDGFPISSGGVIVTSRYHPHFLGALTGVRGLALKSMPYYDVKHTAVHMMGGNWSSLDKRDLSTLFLSALRGVLKEKTIPPQKKLVQSFTEQKKDLAALIFENIQPKMPFSLEILTVWGDLLKECNEVKKEKEDIIESNRNEISYIQEDNDKKINDIVSSKNKIISDYESELLLFSREKDEIINSFYWKLTYPLRYIFSKKYR